MDGEKAIRESPRGHTGGGCVPLKVVVHRPPMPGLKQEDDIRRLSLLRFRAPATLLPPTKWGETEANQQEEQICGFSLEK